MNKTGIFNVERKINPVRAEIFLLKVNL